MRLSTWARPLRAGALALAGWAAAAGVSATAPASVTAAATAAPAAAPAAASAATDIVLRDDRGRTQHFAAPPQRIISLLPSLTESVCALGACARLVGVDRYSNHPAAVAALPKLGGLDDAQVERIVALKPDVVLLGKSARVTDRLEALGLTVVLLESQTHADVRRSLTLIAQLLGTPAEADRVWATIDRDLATAAGRVPPAWRGKRVYFEVAAAPFAAGAGSFIGETLARLGLGNVVPAALGPFPKLNPEYVVRSRPDLVMAVQREWRAMPGRPGWQGMDALQLGRGCGFESTRYETLIRPGPRLGEAALLLADCVAALPTAGLH
jgi:iron complex transport system substrate-binding protein